MKILKFTVYNTGKDVYINLDSIAMWTSSPNGKGTTIYISDGPTVDVKQTPQEVAGMILNEQTL